MLYESCGDRHGDRLLNPTLERCARGFAEAREAITAVAAGLTEEQMQWRPRDDRWSVVECLDHLNAGWTALPKLDRRIAEARADGILETGPFRSTWFGSWYVRAVEPPVRIRVPAPRRFRPRTAPPSVEVVPRLLQLQDELVLRVRASDGLDAGAIRLSSPISRRLKMTLAEWFLFIAGHERRHLWQARRVRDALPEIVS